MQISIQVEDKTLPGGDAAGKQRATTCSRARSALCRLSLLNLFTVVVLIVVVICAVYICKTYIRSVLYWLEAQDTTVIALSIIILFTLVSLPITVGYICLVVADGYLFGMRNGLVLSVIGANTGLAIAHHILRLVAHHHSIQRVGENEMAKAIMRVISGPLCFRIVMCARLTPIPFGLQNTIFALSNVNTKLYHVASFLGLLPAQMLAVYVGTTVRSMQDVIESRSISNGTYILASIQLIMGATLIWIVGTRARKELLKALAEGEAKISTKSTTLCTV